MPNIIEGLQEANNKSRKFIEELDRTAALMHGEGKTAEDDPGLQASKRITQALIDATEKAIAGGDVIEMLQCADLHGLGKSL